MKTSQQRRQHMVRLSTLITLGVIVLLGCSQHALGQWSGNNISNTNSGNVGIGTTAPAHPLEITAPAVINNGSREVLALYDTTSYAAGVGGAITFGGKFNAAGTMAQQFVSIEGIKENGTDGDFASAFRVNTRANGGQPTERFRISSLGYVGIGTSAPSYMLDVAGPIRSSSGGFRFPDCTVQTTAAVGGSGTITGVSAGAGLTGGGTSGSVTLNNDDRGSTQY